MFKQNITLAPISTMLMAICIVGSVAAETLSDPTQPPNTTMPNPHAKSVQNVPRWLLTATYIATDKRVATINGKRLTVGEQIAGATLLAIEPNWVSLQVAKSGKPVVLQLLPKEFKRMAERETDEN